MKPTEEQKRIVKDFKDTRVMKINAVAGSGKTSTLEMLAKTYTKPSLYMAFNKAIADEASSRFPDHVECRTTHSLAFAGFGRDLMHKLSRPKAYKNVAGTPAEIAIYYGIEDIGELPRNTIALFVKLTVQRFEQSAEKKISKKHLPYKRIKDVMETYEDVDQKELTSVILNTAKDHWENRTDPISDVLASHDTYLKLWQLSSPRLDYEILYIDEAQDTNPVVLDIVKNQTHSKVVYVGDTYQSIYQFRGAINAMETINAPTRLLSMSFRYGQEIADVASSIIEYEISIKGNPDVESKVSTVDMKEQFTKLYRTNGKLLEDAVRYTEEGYKIKCEIDVYGFINLLKSAEALKKGDLPNVKHEDILPYKDWSDFKEACEEEPELNRAKRIVEGKKTQDFIKHLYSISKTTRKSYDILLTTAHKSKGRQWKQVVLADDFPELENLSDQERNLLYVSVTRAINTLEYMPV